MIIPFCVSYFSFSLKPARFLMSECRTLDISLSFHLAILTLKNFWNLCKRYYINEIKQSVLKSTKNLSTLIEKDLQILKLEKPKLNKIFNLISQTQLMVKAFCCHSWIWQHNHVIQHRLPRGEFHFHFGLYIVI